MRNVAEPRRESSIAIAALVIACISLLGPRAASAAAGGWEFEITPYLWLSEVHGSVSAKNRTANIDIDFSDIFDALGAGDLLNLAGTSKRGTRSWRSSTMRTASWRGIRTAARTSTPK